jgi:hypothetical protein
MQTSILVMLTVFYAGAVFATGRSWLGAWQGAVGFSSLRDLTGIADRTLLRRLFGLTLADGRYRVTIADVLRHRRLSGVILADLPVHCLFLGSLFWATFHDATPAAWAVACAASAHALILAMAAVAILAGNRQALIG